MNIVTENRLKHYDIPLSHLFTLSLSIDAPHTKAIEVKYTAHDLNSGRVNTSYAIRIYIFKHQS